MLHQQFENRKNAIEKHNSDQITDPAANERFLWHGTSVDAVPEINASGFNRSFAGKNGERMSATNDTV